MSIFSRFFGEKDNQADTSNSLVANPNLKNPLSLQLLFNQSICLKSEAVTTELQSFHSSMIKANAEIDANFTEKGKVFGLVGWEQHVIQLVGFNLPMPATIVETCVAPSHYSSDLKEQARAHTGHVLLYYVGYEVSLLEQYVALIAVAGVLSRFGAIIALNESAHTSFPIAALSDTDGDILELIRTLPFLILVCGFVKYEIEGTHGVWMRTYGAHLLGLPDFAIHADGHHEGQRYFDIFDSILSYLWESGSHFATGHTMQIGEDEFLRLREPSSDEYFLESSGVLFVTEVISPDKINQ